MLESQKVIFQREFHHFICSFSGFTIFVEKFPHSSFALHVTRRLKLNYTECNAGLVTFYWWNVFYINGSCHYLYEKRSREKTTQPEVWNWRAGLNWCFICLLSYCSLRLWGVVSSVWVLKKDFSKGIYFDIFRIGAVVFEIWTCVGKIGNSNFLKTGLVLDSICLQM